MHIRDGGLDDPQVRALLQLHLSNMHETSPPGLSFALDLVGLDAPDVSFYGVWDGPRLLGFGALKEMSAAHGEIKSMRTRPDALRRGVGAMVLDHILDQARARGYVRLSLETGTGPAFEAASALYHRYGFQPGAPFGGYTDSPFNQFLHLEI